MKGFDHPKGYYPLFSVLTLERFSFYGIRTLLILYMLNVLKFEEVRIGYLYGGLILILGVLPLIGGIFSDMLLGAKKSLVFACLSIALADVVMALSSISSSTIIFYTALALLAIGGGLFRPSYYTMLGNLYKDRNDARRDSGFTFAFLASNIGGFCAPLACGYLGEKVSFSLAFAVAGLAAVGAMLISRNIKEPVVTDASKPAEENRHRIYTLLVIAIFVPFLWSVLSQSNDTFNSVFSNFTNVVSGSGKSMIPMMMIIFGFILTPIFTWYWVWSSNNGKVRSTLLKFFWGMVFASVTFAIFYVLFILYQKSGVINICWLGLTTLVFTSAEMFVGPIANSAVTRLAPARYTGTAIGAWVLLSYVANLVGMRLVPAYDSQGGKMVFIIPFAVALLSALIILAIHKPLKKWMHGIN